MSDNPVLLEFHDLQGNPLLVNVTMLAYILRGSSDGSSIFGYIGAGGGHEVHGSLNDVKTYIEEGIRKSQK